MRIRNWVIGLLAGPFAPVAAISVDGTNQASLSTAADTVTKGMMSYYNGNQPGQIPGKLPNTWWVGGAMCMTLLQYWNVTGDTQWNDITSQALLWQAGTNGDYMPANWSSYLGNDDIFFWAAAAMTAAELGFADVPGQFSWLSLVQGVYNDMVARWDNTTCDGGGLRWQLYFYQSGYTLKNSISNGGFFQLAARLARYTGDSRYAIEAEKIWDWMDGVLVISSNWTIWDSRSITDNCSVPGLDLWTYNYGTMLMGAAYMYNYTNGSSTWGSRLDGLLNVTIDTFFPEDYGGGVMSEIACESIKTCDGNMVTFKGFLSTWMAYTALLVPHTLSKILPKLESSATAAGKQCSGGSDGSSCGMQWYSPTWDGTTGMGQEMAASGGMIAPMIVMKAQAPLTALRGGTSKSNVTAGNPSGASSATPDLPQDPASAITITTGDRVGAGILTALITSTLCVSVFFMAKE